MEEDLYFGSEFSSHFSSKHGFSKEDWYKMSKTKIPVKKWKENDGMKMTMEFNKAKGEILTQLRKEVAAVKAMIHEQIWFQENYKIE